MFGLYPLLLLSGLVLADGSRYETDWSPFDPRMVSFNTSQGLYPGHPVLLRCAFGAESPLGMTGEISFVHASYLPQELRTRPLAGYSLGLPENLTTAHKEHGRVLNTTNINTSISSSGFQVTAEFLMNREREGSYLCTLKPHAVLHTLDVMRAEAFLTMVPSPLGTIYAFSAVALVFISLTIGLICWYRRLVSRHTFRRVRILRPTRGCLQQMAGAPAIYRAAQVLVYPEKRPALKSLLHLLVASKSKPPWSTADFRGGAVSSSADYSRPSESTKEEEDYASSARTATAEDGFSSEVRAKTNDLEIVGRKRSTQTVYLLPSDPDFEIPANNIRLCETLGEGAFGTVFKATVKGLPRCSGILGCTEAAIKTLKDGLTDSEVEDFVQEIQMLKYIGQHTNVIRLYATSMQNGRPLMVMEYAALGSLLGFLRKHRTFLQASSQREAVFLQFCKQVATGMEYLASVGIVHRDLAARNVVVTSEGVLKIADFGLTRIVNIYYRMRHPGRLPIKWMSPEALFSKVFSTSSDVWSFGVLMWEVFTIGQTPFAHLSPGEFFDQLRRGLMHPKPEFASSHVYATVMLPCWKYRPEERPSFAELRESLEGLLFATVSVGGDSDADSDTLPFGLGSLLLN